MRIRLRVPTDGEQQEEKTQPGFFARLLNFFSASPAPAPPAAPAPPPPKLDHRWATRGDARYFFAGRLCLHESGEWRPQYLFDVLANGSVQQVCIVLPEPPITAWETRHDKRMTEALRLRLAQETLEALLDLDRLPASMTVAGSAIENAKL